MTRLRRLTAALAALHRELEDRMCDRLERWVFNTHAPIEGRDNDVWCPHCRVLWPCDLVIQTADRRAERKAGR